MLTVSLRNSGRIVVVILVAGFIAWELWLEKLFLLEKVEVIPTRQIQGEVLGGMPKPTQPTLTEPLVEMVSPTPWQKMLIKRIPTISPDAKMPHPSWGPCTRCHLIQGGAPPGSQPATPVAKVWAQVSTIYKVGPPILPNSIQPHPSSGRCIKCHDILIYTKPK